MTEVPHGTHAEKPTWTEKIRRGAESASKYFRPTESITSNEYLKIFGLS